MFAISLALAVAVGATVAVFSDTETSEDNTFTAGTLDLLVNGEEDGDTVESISFSDLKPGDGVGGAEHSTITYNYTFSNTGSLPGQPWIEFTNLHDYDNDCTEPESTTPASDSTCGDPGDGDGELSGELYLQINAAGAGGFEYPHGAGCIDGGRNCPLSYWVSHGPIGQGTWETVAGGGSTAPMVLEFEVPESVGNIIQSDSAEFDIVFHLDQI